MQYITRIILKKSKFHIPANITAIIFSIVNTATANNLDAYKYLEYIFRNLPNSNLLLDSSAIKKYLPWADKLQLECRINAKEESSAVNQPNIDYMMNMTKGFLGGKIDEIAYTFDFPYKLEQRYKKCIGKMMIF